MAINNTIACIMSGLYSRVPANKTKTSIDFKSDVLFNELHDLKIISPDNSAIAING